MERHTEAEKEHGESALGAAVALAEADKASR